MSSGVLSVQPDEDQILTRQKRDTSENKADVEVAVDTNKEIKWQYVCANSSYISYHLVEATKKAGFMIVTVEALDGYPLNVYWRKHHLPTYWNYDQMVKTYNNDTNDEGKEANLVVELANLKLGHAYHVGVGVKPNLTASNASDIDDGQSYYKYENENLTIANISQGFEVADICPNDTWFSGDMFVYRLAFTEVLCLQWDEVTKKWDDRGSSCKVRLTFPFYFLWTLNEINNRHKFPFYFLWTLNEINNRHFSIFLQYIFLIFLQKIFQDIFRINTH